jgi:GMP synthase (glutamine-hydrolysing)
MLLIIDNQSKFIKKFRQHFLIRQDFEHLVLDHNQPINIPGHDKIMGIILSGGKGTPYEPLNLTTNFVALMNYDVPVLGFCLGHEIIAVTYSGKIRKLARLHDSKELITITKPDDPIFRGLESKKVFLRKRHSYHVAELPEDFESLAYSKTCENEIIKHKTKPIYGFQSHPEASGKAGLHMVKNFMTICNLL